MRATPPQPDTSRGRPIPTASSPTRTRTDSRPPSEHPAPAFPLGSRPPPPLRAPVLRWSWRQARTRRSAISARLAIRTFLNIGAGDYGKPAPGASRPWPYWRYKPFSFPHVVGVAVELAPHTPRGAPQPAATPPGAAGELASTRQSPDCGAPGGEGRIGLQNRGPMIRFAARVGLGGRSGSEFPK